MTREERDRAKAERLAAALRANLRRRKQGAAVTNTAPSEVATDRPEKPTV